MLKFSLLVISLFLFSCQDSDSKSPGAKANSPASSDAILAENIFKTKLTTLATNPSIYGVWERSQNVVDTQSTISTRLLIEKNRITVAVRCDFNDKGARTVVYVSGQSDIEVDSQSLTVKNKIDNYTNNSSWNCYVQFDPMEVPYSIDPHTRELKLYTEAFFKISE